MEKTKNRINEIEESMKDIGFWKKGQESSQEAEELSLLKEKISKAEVIEKKIIDLVELVDISDDVKIKEEIVRSACKLKEEVSVLFLERNSSKEEEYSNANAILEISAGAGGVDAQDWTEMLLRMYLKHAEKQGYKAQIVNFSKGGEAGIKSASLELKGLGAYGKLRAEAGVHRLVRLSPFNANHLRQTSFALVEVVPEVKEKELTIKEEDLKIDTFRSGGAGGQHVNTTDSAVRITHLPTGISVVCQNERSQLQNKGKAKKILEGKLYLWEKKEASEKEREIKGEFKKAEWGNQIRSYVIHPYKMVKDHLSNKKSSQVEKFLEGDIDLLK